MCTQFRGWKAQKSLWSLAVVCVCVCMLTCVHRHARGQSCPTFVMPWIVACQASLSMGFSRQEYWSGLPFPPPGNLPDPGIQPLSPTSPALAVRFFTTETERE